MELLQDGVIEIPVPASTIEPGTYYLQILVHEDPESIPYDAEPGGGLPLPGDSFCGGSLVLRAPEETAGDIGYVRCESNAYRVMKTMMLKFEFRYPLGFCSSM